MSKTSILNSRILLLALTLIAPCSSGTAVLAEDTGESISHFAGSGDPATSTSVAADYAIKQGQFDKAIELARASLKENPDDLESHQHYAEALEGKLGQTPQNVKLRNQCVKEWLCVLRSDAGEEKGVGFHGLGLSAGLYDDYDRQTVARVHLKRLVGRTPHPWEPNEKYLDFAQKTSARVSAKVLKANKE